MENLTNIGNIKEILSRHGFSFSKSLGQNFLINPSVCPKIAEAGVTPGKGVIEIGAGIGVLTRELAKIAEKTVAIEIDNRLIPVLSETLSDVSNVKVIHGDIMKLDLRKIIDEEFGGSEVCVCANLPYYITSPVIMKLLESRLPISHITVMVQKEAAVRITAAPGTRETGAISLAVNYYSTPRLLFNVSRGSFMPAPNVDSAVIKLDVKTATQIEQMGAVDEKILFRVIRAGFSQRRKTLTNSLSAGLSADKNTIALLLQKCGIQTHIRPEQLKLQDFVNIANCYANGF